MAQQTEWTGAISTSWSNAANWTNGVPGSGITAVFDANTTNFPAIVGNVLVQNILFDGAVPQSFAGSGTLFLGLSAGTPGLVDNQGNYVATFANSHIAMQDGSVIRASNVNGGGVLFTGQVAPNFGSTITFDAVNSANTITLAGTFSGAGILKAGAGTLMITGAASSLGTTISRGIVQIGDGGTSGTLAGAVADSGMLAFNRSDALTLAGVISGTGDVSQIGAGVTSLTAASTYTGATTISTGTLALTGAGSIAASSVVHDDGTFDVSGTSATGSSIRSLSGSGIVKLGAKTLTLTGAADTFGGGINGTGGLTLAGGTETLTGVSSYTGSTVVNGGNIIVKNGGQIANGSSFLIASPAASNASLTVSGPGSQLVSTGSLVLANGNAANATLTVEDGAVMQVGSGISRISNGTGATATLNVTGNGSSLAGSILTTMNGHSLINVTNGGHINSVLVRINAAGSGTIVVSDAGSRWDNSNSFTQDAGSLSILNGGVLTSGAVNFGVGVGGTVTSLVSGAGSQLVGTTIGVGTGGNGTLTIADGGDVAISGGAGALVLSGATSSGTLNIGGAVGEAATHSGTLHASGITFGSNLGTVSFNHIDNNYAFDALMSGAGSVNHAGSGSTVLSADNTYTGATTIDAGTLRINGDQSLATGLTSVNTGATLGGSGVVGGNVTVADGGAIAPGNSPGKLTVNGNLSLSSGSSLNFELGEANVVGGASNDLLHVVGDLSLDGTLNVSTPGAFGGGVYRLIDYDGALTDNGLTLGAMPSGSAAFIQTSFAHQVNLINTAGLTLKYWDGAADPKFDGAINGGNGLWQNHTGNDNWTESTGAVNGKYADDGFAVFGGTAGTVTVDNSLGNVTTSGMQFSTDGYRVEGASIGLLGTAPVIRVGDGTAASATYKATIASALTGSTGLEKTDLGTLVLTGDNTYTGGTKITSGTVQLGDGGMTGSIASDINNNGTLAVDHSNAVTISGTISGTGAVNQIGSGTTTLWGANTYTGGTTISSGTLVGSVSSFGTGAIQDNSALVIDQSTDGTLASALNGTGSFTKQGAGAVSYSGTGNLNGATTIMNGTLAMNGSLARSAVTVRTGATLTGAGTVGATTAEKGSTIAPGNNTIGQLNVNGNYTQESGSTYQVELDPNSDASDRISVAGEATVASGAVLNVTKTTSSPYRIGTRYTVVDAAGGLTGTYTVTGETSTPLSAFLGLVDTYDTNHAYLTVEQLRDLTDAAGTPEQTATAGGLESTPGEDSATTGTLKTIVLNSPTDEAAQFALNQLSGEARSSAQTAEIEDGHFVRDAVLGRVRDAFCAVATERSQSHCTDADRFGVWGEAFGSRGHTDSDGNTATLNRSTGGLFVGIDAPAFNGWRLGMVGGFGSSAFDVKDRASSGSSDDYHLGIYSGTQRGRFGFRAGAAYTVHGIVTSRSVTLPGFADTLSGDYNAGTAQLFGDLGYKIGGGRVALEPFGDVAYVSLHTNAFSERGGEAALASDGNSTNVTFTTLGLRPEGHFTLGAINTTLRGSVGWQHGFGDLAPVSHVSFAGGSSFGVTGAPLAEDAAVTEAGLDLNVSDRTSLGVSYRGQFGGDATDQDVRGNVTLRF
jgi:outer membrane autotransporter protein